MTERVERFTLFEDRENGDDASLPLETGADWDLPMPVNVISRSPVHYPDNQLQVQIERQMQLTAARQAKLLTGIVRQAELDFERGRIGARLYKKLLVEIAYSMQEMEEFSAFCLANLSPKVAARVQDMVENGMDNLQTLPAAGTRVFLSRYS